MITAEWMPVNPCPCGAIRYPDGHKCNVEDGECSPLAYYDGAIDYQGKLLEYLITNTESIFTAGNIVTNKIVYKHTLESMLKQLDMDKSMMESENGQLIDRGSFAKYVEAKHE
jgi:hypothetical protein